MLELIWRDTALDDLEFILGYIGERNLAAAVKLRAEIEACAARLPEHPHLYRKGRISHTREAVVHPNYILVYRIDTATIDIVNIIHTRRQYPSSDPE